MARTREGGMSSAKQRRWWHGWTRNLNAKVAALPMIFTTLVVFVGCSLWTVLYSFTKSKLLPKQIFDWPLNIQFPISFFDQSMGYFSWVGFAYEWDWKGFGAIIVSKNFVGLAQYERLLDASRNGRWAESVENIVTYGVFSLVFSFTVGFILAALIDQKVRFENAFRTIFLYPFALSFVVTGVVWQWMLSPSGIQDAINQFGAWSNIGFLETLPFKLMASGDTVVFALLIAGLWQGTGFTMVLMLAGLRGIDGEIWKAARVDGIPAWKTYIFVVIPMMRGVFITTLVIAASGIVRLYDLVVVLTNGGPGFGSEVPAKYVFDYMFARSNLGQALSASTMMLITVVIILIPWMYLEYGRRKRT